MKIAKVKLNYFLYIYKSVLLLKIMTKNIIQEIDKVLQGKTKSVLRSKMQHIWLEIFSYLGQDANKIPQLSKDFNKIYNCNQNYIYYKIFQNRGKRVDVNYSFQLYKYVMWYDEDNETCKKYNMEMVANNYFIEKSIDNILHQHLGKDYTIGVVKNVINFILQEYSCAMKNKILDRIITYLLEYGIYQDMIKTLIYWIANTYELDIDKFIGTDITPDADLLWDIFVEYYNSPNNNTKKITTNRNIVGLLIYNFIYEYDERIFILHKEYNIDVVKRLRGDAAFFDFMIKSLLPHFHSNKNTNFILRFMEEFGVSINDYPEVRSMVKNSRIIKSLV
jgi:hypothetical protein